MIAVRNKGDNNAGLIESLNSKVMIKQGVTPVFRQN